MNEEKPTSDGVAPTSGQQQERQPRPEAAPAGKTPKKKGGRSPWLFVAGAVVIILAALALWDPLGLLSSTLGKNAVALVNGEAITQSEYDARTTQVRGSLGDRGVDLTQEGADEQVKNQVLQSLITETIILQKAEAEDMVVSSDAVDAELEEIRGRFDSDDEYDAELDRNGFTPRSFRTHVRDQLTIQRYLASRVDPSAVSVSDEEVRSAYDQAVAATEGDDAPAFAQVQGQVRANLEQQKLNQAIAPIIQQLTENADIEVRI